MTMRRHVFTMALACATLLLLPAAMLLAQDFTPSTDTRSNGSPVGFPAQAQDSPQHQAHAAPAANSVYDFANKATQCRCYMQQ